MAETEKKIKLLLVEDHRVTMAGLRAWMEETGEFDLVGAAATADAAIELARLHVPDVTLLDLHLGEGASIEKLLADLSATGTRIVVFSAESRKYFVDLVLASGAFGFVSKSDDYDAIVAAVKAAASGQNAYISPAIARDRRGRFTEAEQELLSMLARGMKYDDIALARITSPHTVRKQCDRLQIKLRLTSREELIAWAVANGYAGV